MRFIPWRSNKGLEAHPPFRLTQARWGDDIWTRTGDGWTARMTPDGLALYQADLDRTLATRHQVRRSMVGLDPAPDPGEQLVNQIYGWIWLFARPERPWHLLVLRSDDGLFDAFDIGADLTRAEAGNIAKRIVELRAESNQDWA